MEKQLIMTWVDVPEPEPKKKPANTEAGRQREIVAFLRERGVKRALIDGDQYYFCENIDPQPVISEENKTEIEKKRLAEIDAAVKSSYEQSVATICEDCGAEIPDDTDDNYNVAHDMICCEECDYWQCTGL